MRMMMKTLMISKCKEGSTKRVAEVGREDGSAKRVAFPATVYTLFVFNPYSRIITLRKSEEEIKNYIP